LGIQGSSVLPEFAIGSHRLEVEPGSAPLESIYWFEDVLICLATHLDQKEISEAPIAIHGEEDSNGDEGAATAITVNCHI
jgi:hypothetical protein